MDNAFTRMGSIRYSKTKKDSVLEFEALCPLAVLEPESNRILYLEMVGSDSVLGGLAAALHDREPVTIILPDGSRLPGCMFLESDEIQSAQERIDLHAALGTAPTAPGGRKPKGRPAAGSGRKRNRLGEDPLSRTVYKAMFASFEKIAVDGFVPVLSHDPREVMFELAERLVLPIESHWAAWLFARLGEQEGGVIRCDSFGIDALIVTVKRAVILNLISQGIKAGALRSKTTAPPRLRKWQVRDLHERRLRWIAASRNPVLFTTTHSNRITPRAKALLEAAGFTAQTLLTWQTRGAWGLVSEAEREANERFAAEGPGGGPAGVFQVISRFRIGGQRLEVVTGRESYGQAIRCRIRVEHESVSRSVAA